MELASSPQVTKEVVARTSAAERQSVPNTRLVEDADASAFSVPASCEECLLSV